MPISGAKYLKTYQSTPEYQMTMDLYVHNINNNYKNIWSKIYETIDEPYFGEVGLFSKDFLYNCKNNTNVPHNISSKIKKNIKIIDLEEILYTQVVMVRC